MTARTMQKLLRAKYEELNKQAQNVATMVIQMGASQRREAPHCDTCTCTAKRRSDKAFRTLTGKGCH